MQVAVTQAKRNTNPVNSVFDDCITAGPSWALLGDLREHLCALDGQ